MARPDEDRPSGWVDTHRRALEQLSVSQTPRYAPREVPAGAYGNGELPQWMRDFNPFDETGRLRQVIDAGGRAKDEALDLLARPGPKTPLDVAFRVGSSLTSSSESREKTLRSLGTLAGPIAEPFVQFGKATDRMIVENDPTFRSLFEKNLQKKTFGARNDPRVRDEVSRETLDQAASSLLSVRNDPNATDAEKNSADLIAGLITAKRFTELGGPWIAKGGAELLARGAKSAVRSATSARSAMKVEDLRARIGADVVPKEAIPASAESPAEGVTRLYRGEAPGGAKSTSPEAGRWFTTDQATAAKYGGGAVHYVDVPTADLPKYARGVVSTDIKKIMRGGAPEQFVLPPEIASAKIATKVEAVGKAGQRTPNPELKGVASGYLKAMGMPEPRATYTNVDRALAKSIADFYEVTPDMAADPAVQQAYAAFNAETSAQADALKAAGYVAEPWTKKGQPYKNSAEMRADVQNNKHIYYFKTDEGSPIHALMTPEQNDTFRWVHDIFGHALNGNEFGAVGEENAWLAHSQMFSEAARAAMSTETRAQNSWVNFGPHGEANRMNPASTVYPPQKALLLPDEMRQPAGSATSVKATPKQIEESVATEAERALDVEQRSAAQALAVDEPSVGKRTWSAEEKMLLSTLDTGRFRAANIVKHVISRTQDQINVGRAWYEQLRRDFAVTASELGIDYDAFVGVVASLSPRTSWPRGRFHLTEGGNATRAFDTNFPSKNNVKGAEMLVKEWQSNSVLQSGTLEEVRAELKRVGASQWTTYPNGAGAAGKGNAEKAIRILNGEEPASVLRQKTGSFLDNFLGNEDNVTGDVWAIRAALDDPKAPDKLTPAQYKQLQNAYRQAAAELGLTPEALQAIAWDSVRENPRFAAVSRITQAEARRAAVTWDTVSAEIAASREVPTTLGAFDMPARGRTARGYEGHPDRPGADAERRILQLGDVSTTNAARQYEVAKDVPGFRRTAAEKIAVDRAQAEGKGGGTPDVGFQKETFSPQSQPTIGKMKDAMRPGLERVTAPISHEDTLLAAQLTGHTPEWAAKTLPKRGVLSTDITKVSLGIEEKLSILDNLAGKGAGVLSREERLDAVFAMKEAAALMKDFSEGVSETARALNARKIAMKRSLVIDPSEGAWREALRQIAGSKTASADRIDKLLEQLMAVRGDRSKTLGILRQLNRGSGWDMAFEYSQSAILSAMPTHAVNTYSGMVQHALMFGRVVGETPVAMAIEGGQRLLGKSVTSAHGPEDIVGFVLGYLDGLKGVSGRTADLMRRRMDFYEYAQGQYAAKHGAEMIPFGGSIPGRIGEIVRTPFKALTIEDLFQTMPAFSGRIRQLATQQARSEGLKGLAALKRASEIVRDAPDELMFKSSSDFAERYALHTRGPKLRAVQHIISEIPGLRYLMRFTTTPTNLVQMGLDYSPLGFTRIKDAKTVADAAAITAEAAIGTSIIGTFLGMLESGEMTGLRSTNKTERDIMEAEGVGPMMIQSSKVPFVGGLQNLFNQNGDANKRWVTGAVLGPLVVPYLIAAAIREAEAQSQNPDPKAMQAAVGAMVRTFADQVPMLQSIRDVQNIIENPITVRNGEVEGAIPDLAGQTLRTFVPSFLGMFERMSDQYKRDPQGIAQTIQAIIPVLAAHGFDVGPLHVLPVQGKSDVLGRAVPNANTGALALVPRGSVKSDPHPVLVENERLASFGFPGFTGVTATGRQIGTGTNAVNLNPDAAARYQEIAGQLTERLLGELIGSPTWSNKTDEQKAKDFQTKIDYARIEARKRLAQEFMGTITDDFGIPAVVARVATDRAKGIAIGMRATPKLWERADFIGSFLTQIDQDPALRDAVATEMSNRPRGTLQKGAVSRVVDGDTVMIGERRIRLFGVDVPEKNTPAGRAAYAALNEYLTGKDITYQLSDQTTFERSVGDIFANGKSVSDWLVENGYGTVHLPPESDPNRYSLEVYRQVIPLRQKIKSDPVLSAEYTRNGQVVGDPQVWVEADRQKKLWDQARNAGDTTLQADRKYPVYAVYRLLNSQTGGKNPVRKKFVDDAEKKGIPLSKFIADLDNPSSP